MKNIGFSLVGAFLLTVLPGAVLAQTTGGTSHGASGTTASRSATPGMTTPGLGAMPLPLPATGPVGRSTTGIIENQQTLDRAPGQPSSIETKSRGALAFR
jgi:hypothetical protein